METKNPLFFFVDFQNPSLEEGRIFFWTWPVHRENDDEHGDKLYGILGMAYFDPKPW
jgi:hypothetical protein